MDGGICIGRGSIINDKPDELFIDGLSTLPEFRRQGYASFLLDRMAELASSKGLKRLVLWVDVDKPENKDFYLRRGFRVGKEDETYIEMVKAV